MVKKDLQDWLDFIGEEVDAVDTKPYSHNLISLALRAIAKTYGNEEANSAIDRFGLEDLGWTKQVL